MIMILEIGTISYGDIMKQCMGWGDWHFAKWKDHNHIIA